MFYASLNGEEDIFTLLLDVNNIQDVCTCFSTLGANK